MLFYSLLVLLILLSLFYLCYNFLYLFPFFTCHIFLRSLIVFPFVVRFTKLSIIVDHVASNGGVTDEMESICRKPALTCLR